MQIDLAPSLLPLFAVGMWLLVVSLIAFMGGWRSLAGAYRAPDGFELDPATRFRFRSLQLRRGMLFPANYSNMMTVGLTEAGLYLEPFVLFRFQHRPLLIPWTEITDCRGGSFLWLHWVDLFPRVGPVIRLYDSIADEAWGEWRVRVHR